MRNKSTSQTKIFLFVLLYFSLWIILFEFIIPANNTVPKPSIVFLSFSALWNDYNLLTNSLVTITSVYIPLIAAYFLLELFASLLIKPSNFLEDFLMSLNWFSNYIPAIIFGIFLIYWFPYSNLIEFIFSFVFGFLSLAILYLVEVKHVEREYLDSAISLGANEGIILRKVIWKAVQPKLFRHLIKLHFNIWSVLIIFEFIKGSNGIGEIFRLSLSYHDVSALFAVFLITGVLIYLGVHIIKYLQNKFCHWSFN